MVVSLFPPSSSSPCFCVTPTGLSVPIPPCASWAGGLLALFLPSTVVLRASGRCTSMAACLSPGRSLLLEASVSLPDSLLLSPSPSPQVLLGTLCFLHGFCHFRPFLCYRSCCAALTYFFLSGSLFQTSRLILSLFPEFGCFSPPLDACPCYLFPPSSPPCLSLTLFAFSALSLQSLSHPLVSGLWLGPWLCPFHSAVCSFPP